MEKQGPDLPSYLKQPKNNNGTKKPTSKPHERMVFKTLHIGQQRTVIWEMETSTVNPMISPVYYLEAFQAIARKGGGNKMEPSRLPGWQKQSRETEENKAPKIQKSTREESVQRTPGMCRESPGILGRGMIKQMLVRKPFQARERTTQKD